MKELKDFYSYLVDSGLTKEGYDPSMIVQDYLRVLKNGEVKSE